MYVSLSGKMNDASSESIKALRYMTSIERGNTNENLR